MTTVKLQLTDREGTTHDVAVEAGSVLMHVIRDNIDFDVGVCGGEISCGTCLVKLCPEWSRQLENAGEDEQDMLDALQAEPGARLGCQVTVGAETDGMQAQLLHEE